MPEAEPKLLWTPSPERIERATLTRYQAWLEEKRGLRFEGYHDLWRWSVSDLEAFWGSLVEFVGRSVLRGGERVLGRRVDAGRRVVPGRASQLRRAHVRRQGPDGALAIQHASESRELASMTWGELRA